MSTRALVAVSFGTSYSNAQKAITNVEDRLKEEFVEYDFFRAFTSSMIIKKIKHTQGITILTLEEVLKKLYEEGYEEVICQSLHVIHGDEYNKAKKVLEQYCHKFKIVKMGMPLLSSKEDYTKCSEIIVKYSPILNNEESIILMGHGTEHVANASYCQLENTLRFMRKENIYVATVEGFPELDYAINRLGNKNINKVYLIPFMIVAGDHAQNDLAGEEESSWKSLLEKNGYKTEVILKGLGEYKEIAELFVKHCKNAIHIFTNYVENE